jgi:hypothetical protein
MSPDTAVQAVDADDVYGAARAAQARFEIRRARLLPRSRGGSNGPCDENVGRFCSWYGEGGWVPEPEVPEIATLRAALLDTLDALQAAAPADDWILGQRVWYRAEEGEWPAALEVARGCAPPQESWWCAALRGLALHGLGRWQDAERAFDVALWEMDLERAWRWRVPSRAVDGDGRAVLTQLREASTDSVARLLDRMWSLADPLHVVAGNDRKTAHLARWTVATLRGGSRTTYGISWGSDLEELVVRNGWELGWEREVDPWRAGPDRVIGRKHPAGRDYLPPGKALVDPASAEPTDLLAARARPRSLYAPPYAPVVLPMDVQVAVFPRGRRFIVVAGHELPADTTWRTREGIPSPWMDPGDQANEPHRAGLYLLDAESGDVTARAISSRTRGVLWADAPAGRQVVSVESWSPPARRAGRLRYGLDLEPTPDDIPVLSDLLLTEAAATEPATLLDVLPLALPRSEVTAGSPLGVAWEVTGLGFRSETLAFALSLERDGGGILRRLGGWFGLTDPDRPLSLEWEEAGPGEPVPLFRYLTLELPDVDPGRYVVRLTLRTAGRDPVVAERAVEIRAQQTPR